MRIGMRRLLRLVLKSSALCVLLLTTSLLLAQSTTVTIQGTVTDETGAVVPDAQVTAVNTATNYTRVSKTDGTGNYLLAALPYGTYNITVEVKGMGRQTVKALTVDAGRTIAQNFKLKPASVAETVEITGEPPVIESTTMTVGEVVNTAKVQELPLNGRHILELSGIVPGTVVPPANGFLTAAIRGQGALGVNTAGTREGTTNFMVNGINLVDMGNGQITFQPSINTVSEFKMDNSTPSAEYGRNAGGVINVATRSGSNQWHGEAFDFFRNEALDARNFFNPDSSPKAKFKRNDFGAAIGGPIWKDRTFFFFSYEGLRQRQGVTVNTTVLSQNQRSLVTDPTSQKLLQFIPAASDTTNPDATIFTQGLSAPVNLDQWTGDVRHVFNQNDTLHGFYVLQKDLRQEPTLQGGSVPGAGDTRQARRQILTLDETHVVSPTLVNDFRAGINRIHITFVAANNADPSSLGINDGKSGPVGIPQVTIGGTNLQFGGITGFPQGRGDYTAVVADTVSYLHGRHNIKFGTEIRRFNGNSFTNDAGTLGFKNLAAFEAGTPNAFTINSTSRPARVYEGALGFFGQDSFKVTSYLTLEMGLRWEWNMSPTEAMDRTSLFLPDKDWLVQVGTNGRDNIYNQNASLFQPRVGFAWDMSHDGKTVLRGGFGIMYDQPNPITFAGNWPYNLSLSFISSGAKPTTTYANLFNDAKGSGFTVGTVDPNFKNDYVESYNLNIERAITPTLGVMVGYIGNEARHLNTVLNINQLVPGPTPGTYVRPFLSLAADSPIQPPAGLTKLGNINQQSSNGTSNYNAMWITVNKRLSHGLQFGSNYTWSHAFDQVSRNGLAVSDALNPSLDYGPSDYDARHHFSFSTTYQLPFKGNRAIDGWQLGTILTLQSGNPLNITSGNPGKGTSITTGFTGLGGVRPDLTGSLPSVGGNIITDPTSPNYGRVQWFPSNIVCDPTNPSTCSSSSVFTIPLQVVGTGVAPTCYGSTNPPLPTTCASVFHFGNLGRNAMVGPGFSDLDFSITKTTKITERLSNEFRVEAFDILNHPNFANPGTAAQVGSTSFGVISSTRGPNGDAGSARQIQFAMKFIF